jgi:HD domain-containing protein
MPGSGSVGGIPIPGDTVSRATWAWAQRRLPSYLLAHSVRAYCWGATLAANEGLAFDAPILWSAALIHDVGLTQIPRNRTCFEYQGGEIARRLLVGEGMARDDADRAARAIELHMAPSVTLDDGVESVLLDRATGVDVRGAEFRAIDGVRDAVMQALPRGDFDRLFLAGIRREVAGRPGCQSERLLPKLETDGRPARNPWHESRDGRAR